MKETNENRKSPFRTLLTILLLIAVIPLLCCGGVVIWFFGRQSVAAKELSDRTAQLQADGVPVDNPSLQSFHQSLTSDQYTDLWVSARDAVESQEFVEQSRTMPVLGEGADVPAAGRPWPQEEEVLNFLKQHESLIQQIQVMAAAELDPDQLPMRRPIQFEGVMTLLEDAQAARTFARLLVLQHRVALRQGDSDRVFACIQATRGLSSSFDGEPVMVSQLVGIAINALANEMLQLALAEDVLSKQQLETISDSIDGFDQSYQRYQLAIIGERAMNLPVFTDPEQAKAMLEMEGVGSSAMVEAITKIRSRDGVFFLDEMEKLEHLPATSAAEFRRTGQQWEKDFQAQQNAASATEKIDKVMTYLLMPAMGSVTAAFTREIESNHLAKTAIAIRLFRFEFDRWPKNLAELKQIGFSTDLFAPAGDRPFGYQTDSDQARVWGIDRANFDEIPDQPPEDDDDLNKNWRWELKSSAN